MGRSLGHGKRIETLALPGIPASDLQGAAAEALRGAIVHPHLPQSPEQGWRVLDESPASVVFAAPDLSGTGWVVVRVEEREGVWGYRRSGYGASPGPTAAQRGVGLQLRWTGIMRVARNGSSRHSNLILVNNRSIAWDDDQGEYWAIGHLFDPRTEEEIPLGEHGIAGVGRSYRLDLGASVEIAVAMGDRSTLAPGRYGIVACLSELALASPMGALDLGTSRVGEGPNDD